MTGPSGIVDDDQCADLSDVMLADQMGPGPDATHACHREPILSYPAPPGIHTYVQLLHRRTSCPMSSESHSPHVGQHGWSSAASSLMRRG